MKGKGLFVLDVLCFDFLVLGFVSFKEMVEKLGYILIIIVKEFELVKVD